MWQYIFESWAWSIGGLALGYAWGRTERKLIDLNRKMDEHDD